MTTLIYIADPMCSWCYGFGPQLSALLEGVPELPLEIVMGGLRPYNEEVMDQVQRTTLLSHWQRVEEMTGLPFSPNTLARENFVYNTEPACRAVVTARLLAPPATLSVLHAIQHAFYASGLDITSGEVLAEIAATVLTQAGLLIDATTFAAKWAEEATILATHADFVQSKTWDVTGFPTLILEHDGQLALVTSGYMPIAGLVDKLQALVDSHAQKQH